MYFVVSGMPACVDLTALHVDWILHFVNKAKKNKELMVSNSESLAQNSKPCVCCFYRT